MTDQADHRTAALNMLDAGLNLHNADADPLRVIGCALMGLLAVQLADRVESQADAWDQGYRNGYSIGYKDDPNARTNYENPYRSWPEEQATVEIGGQTMTEAQFNAARYPLLNSDPGPTVPFSPSEG